MRAFSAAFGLPLTTLHKTLRAERVVDVEDLYSICEPLGIDAADVVAAAERAMLRPLGKLTQLPLNVGGFVDDALHGIDTAAGTDETQADDDGA
ncbi:MAG: hypothetical protein KGL39_26490 [Patescibacteria group bacterium]|nr:hypothetical protein [Patescibacteria group bacterium]